MSYDGNDSYPKPGSVQSARTVSAGTYSEDLKDRVMEMLKSVTLDMKQLQEDRSKYHQYYMAEKIGNEQEGRSQVVMSDVQDTIESLMPSMMRIFYSGTEVLNIRPQGPEDELKCKLMEEKVNWDFQKRLPGFRILYTFIKDALLYKMGVVKYYWKKEETMKSIPPMENLTSDQYLALTMNPDIVIQSTKIRALDMEGNEVVKDKLDENNLYQAIFYSAEVKRKIRNSMPVAENLPPEEFLFDIKAKDIKKSFCAHRKRIHRKQLKKYGVSEDEADVAIKGALEDPLYAERFADLGGSSFIIDPKDKNYVFIYECYICDYDEDGEEIPMIVTVFADRVLKVEENSYGRPPFVVMSPILIPHRLCGRSISELVLEVQKLRTALVRYILDNIYFQNQGMNVVNPFRIDVESMKTGNRPGGMIFTKFDIEPNTAIMPVPIKPLPSHIMNLLEYSEIIKENRTGVTRYNQGLDSKSLNRTATGISQIMGAAQQRIELIARVFAETGIRDLFQAFVDMNIDYFDEATNIKVNQQWQMIRPDDISGEFDVVIDVGIGTGSKEITFNQKVQMLNMYGMMAKQLGPMTQGIFDIKNLKNILKGMWEDQGYKTWQEYLANDQMTQMVDMLMKQQMMPQQPPPQMGGMNGPNGAAVPGGGGQQAPQPPPNQGVLPPMGVPQ